METIYFVVLIPMVYIAFAIFIFGTIFRIINMIREPKPSSTLQIYPTKQPSILGVLHDTFLLPTVRKHNPLLWIFLMLFHISFLFLILGHVELIDEFKVIQLIEHEVFLGRGVIGLILSVSLLFFLFRRFITPYRELSVPEDYYLLILLFLAVLFGAMMDWARSIYEYGELSVDDYREYLSGLILLRPTIPDNILLTGHSFMLVVHVFFANLFLIFFPFSKIMHSFFSLPMNKIRKGI